MGILYWLEKPPLIIFSHINSTNCRGRSKHLLLFLLSFAFEIIYVNDKLALYCKMGRIWFSKFLIQIFNCNYIILENKSFEFILPIFYIPLNYLGYQDVRCIKRE